MNCAYKNYLYIYNIKLMEENILLIKKNPSNMFFVLLILKNFFINSIKLFFLEQKLFFRTVFKNSN